jgi:hypothetical protein
MEIGVPRVTIIKPATRGEEWLRKLAELKAETSVPGYWENLESLCDEWARLITADNFWHRVRALLKGWRVEYRSVTGADLLDRVEFPEFSGKQKERIRSKLDKKIEDKPDFIREVFPDDGPPIPRLNDLVRTRFICNYMDGVEFLTKKILGLAEEWELRPSRERVGLVEGYFAQHLNFWHRVVYRFAGAEQIGAVSCEIQVATVLSTRLWEARHPLYEVARRDSGHPEDWQWNPKDPRFISNQLGHMIHLADGLLVQLREVTQRNRDRKEQR